MGQQQLLLLVLSTVIVGFSIVVGLDAYTGGERNARKELANTKMAEIASRAIGWRTTPKVMQGGRNVDGSSSFDGFTLSKLGLSDTEYLYLSDGSCISCAVTNSGEQLDIHWLPDGGCESGSSDIQFKLEVTGTTLSEIAYIQGDYNWGE